MGTKRGGEAERRGRDLDSDRSSVLVQNSVHVPRLHSDAT
jgi:hypothetical protein